MQQNSAQLVQVGLHMRHVRTPTTMNPEKYAGMKKWEELSHNCQALVTAALNYRTVEAAHDVIKQMFTDEQRESIKAEMN